MDTGDKNAAASPKPNWSERLQRIEKLVPAFAVGLVSITAVATALLVTRSNAPDPALEQADASGGARGVVQAPPLNMPAIVAAQEQPENNARTRPAAGASGTGPTCGNCGVVETVVAVPLHGYAEPRASGYQMHIRMDDGSMRTVEQRGALAAGSRVIVERRSVRVLPKQG